MLGVNPLKSHWTINTISCGFVIGTSYLFLKDSHGFPWIEKCLRHSDLPNAINDDLMMSIEQELFTVTSKHKYPQERTNFNIMVCDNIESKTYGGFQHRHNALLSLSTRVVLNDVQTIRKNYPNLLKLFKENGLNKCDDALDTETLKDNDLESILLSQNAKKFVIARELLYASSSKFILPVVVLFFSSFPCFGLCYFLRYYKVNDWIALISSAILGVICVYLFMLMYYKSETLKLDYEASQLDEDHKAGCIDYLKSSIKLCKLINKLTKGKSYFDEDGNYTWHAASYVERLQRFKIDNKIKI